MCSSSAATVLMSRRSTGRVWVVRTGGVDRIVRVKAAANAPRGVLADLVIVLVKSFDTRRGGDRRNRHWSDPKRPCCRFRTASGTRTFSPSLVGSRTRPSPGLSTVGGALRSPGHVIAGIEGARETIHRRGSEVADEVERIAATFEAAGLKFVVSRNIMGTMWDKLLVNVATGALSGITRLAYGELYAVPELEATAIAAVAEAMAVAKASGITLETTHPHEPGSRPPSGLPAEFKASMLQSLEKGSGTEVDFINGAVVREGAKSGVPTPVNTTLVACVKGIERAGLASWRGHEDRNYPKKAYLEHVAIRVKDIQWHIRFFRDVLGMTLREVQGDQTSPRQVWTVGGLQLMADPDFEGPEGRFAHLGVMCEDVDAAIATARASACRISQGNELVGATGRSYRRTSSSESRTVQAALAIDPRA